MILETGELAKFATSSVFARQGETIVLVTIVAGDARDDIDYFPLSVEYVERLYAGGRIKGSRWVKREGRPTDDAILNARLIDRSIRPLFPKNYKKDVQVVVTILSVDGENDPDVLAINAVSAAIAISPIPWNGPVGAVRVGYVKEKDSDSSEYLINPGAPEQELTEMDMIVSQNSEKTVMIEAGVRELPEDVVLAGIDKAHEETKKIISTIEKFAKDVNNKKEEVQEPTALLEMIAKLQKNYKSEIEELMKARVEKESSRDEMSVGLIERIFEEEKMKDPKADVDKKLIAKAIETVLFKLIRSNILEKGKRPDGRAMDEIRSLASKVSVLPRTHGSAIFQRGDTQVLTVATLASPRLEQLIESAEGEEAKKYIHHYSFPPYSVGETGRMGSPSRREIGHGALAERALEAVIPNQETFPYTIRLVSEVLSSNGSTSMASTCGSTLALMDAGVPIKNPVSGIAMGLMSSEKGDKYEILTDILGLEDFSGDMDFKITGSEVGITAIQLDVKIPGLTVAQIKEVFERAKTARLQILENMLSVLPEYRKEVSEYAPKIEIVKVPVDKIGEVIGPGGKVIKGIIAQTGATVDVEDDGTVAISSSNEEDVQKAVEWVKGLVREVKPGEVFEGEVKRILPFGAFVEVLPGKEGMVHVSHMSSEYVKNPNDVVSIGDKVKVRVLEIDDQGRVNLSMKFGPDADKPRENRGGFEERGGGGHGQGRPMRGPRHDDPRGGKDHPLSMQFRRERQEEFRKRNDRRPGGRPPFKKAHY
jgi:polyribonucleotide nucleotidyltransferase